MDLELSEDQAELRTVARDLLAERGDLAPARAFLEGKGDATALQDELIALGWPAVGVEDDGFGIPGLCLLAEQVGAHAAPVALVDAAVVARLARACAADLAATAAQGEQHVALAVVEERAGWSLDHAEAAARPDGGSFRLNAVKLGVHHAARAELFAVSALIDDEPAFLLVPAVDALVEPALGLDPAAATAAVIFADVLVPAGGVVRGDAVEQALAVGAVATAAEAVGAASRALDMAVAYAGERRQFGRPIGSFQALAHLMADMYVARETAWSTTLYAAAALEEKRPDAAESVSVAKAFASDAAREVVEGALQVLGGIGFTWEHDVHLLQRRILECERRFGDAIDHERRVTAGLAARSASPALG